MVPVSLVTALTTLMTALFSTDFSPFVSALVSLVPAFRANANARLGESCCWDQEGGYDSGNESVFV